MPLLSTLTHFVILFNCVIVQNFLQDYRPWVSVFREIKMICNIFWNQEYCTVISLNMYTMVIILNKLFKIHPPFMCTVSR